MSQVEALDHLPGIPPKRRRPRWRLCLGVALVLFVLWLAAMYAFFAYWTDRDLREAMAAADRDSPEGWQLDDLEAHREQVPDEENAALVATKIKSLLPMNWPLVITPAEPEPAEKEDGDAADPPDPPELWYGRLHDLSPEVQLDAPLLQDLRASLAKVLPARAEARKLIGMTRGRFPLQWHDNVWLTTLSSGDARTAANLLVYEAALASQEGDADGAVGFVRAIVGIARSVGDEPFLISLLIRLACDMQAVAALERALAQGQPTARELELVQARLEKEAAEALLVQALRGERAGMHKMLLSIRHGTASLAQIAGATGGFEKQVADFSGPTLARYSHARVLQLLNEYVEAGRLPPEKQLPVVKNLERKIIQAKVNYDIVTALLMPAIMRVAEAHARGVGNLRCAFVGVALERYRRDHGRWPDALDALVPKYLAAVPKDPQDGQPLRFKRTPDGVVVYWIGHDGTDDGGKIDRGNPQAEGTDEGFQLWHVRKRRQAARELLPLPAEEEVP